MKIPQGFTKAIKDTFYDKELTEMAETTSENDFGERTVALTPTANTILGNVRFSNLEEIRENYGIRERIDIAITTDEEVDLGSIWEYRDRYYRIVQAIPNDSHNFLVGQIWS